MFEDIHTVDKSIGGIVGLFLGLFIGAIAMFKKLSTYDETLKDQAEEISAIKENFMPRSEIIGLHKESQSEIKELHKDMSSKLDTINGTLLSIQVTLAKKADVK